MVELALQLDVDPVQPAVDVDARRSARMVWVSAVRLKFATDAEVWLMEPDPVAEALMTPVVSTTGVVRLPLSCVPERVPPTIGNCPVSTRIADTTPWTLTSTPFPWPL